MEKIMMNKKMSKLVMIAALLFCTVSASANIIFVDPNATDAGYSSLWVDNYPTKVYTNVQDALTAAGSDTDIWVAAGTYVPGTATTNYFMMKDGVDLYGSFTGNEDPDTFDLADRDFDANPTILSGQVGGTADVVIVSVGAKVNDPVVDGFIISKARIGVYTVTTDLVLKSCIIKDNTYSASVNASGVGIRATGGASPVIEDCIVESNEKSGIYFESTTSPVVKNCIVRLNGKKGIECDGGDTTIIDCWIHHNIEQGIYVHVSDAGDEIRNNTIVYNNIGKTTGAGGFYNAGAVSTNIENCIFWGNEPFADQIYRGTPTYSCIMNGTVGAGNIIDDPMFDDAADPENDFHLLPGSPCIDAGNPDPNLYIEGEVDLDGDPRVLNDIIDMGADEYLDITIKSADFDDSGRVTLPDFATFGQAWLSVEGEGKFNEACDLDSNGDINMDDLLYFVDQWLLSPFDLDNSGGVVNYPDFAIFAKAWLASEGNGDFNEACDFNDTGIVDFDDLVEFANRWLN